MGEVRVKFFDPDTLADRLTDLGTSYLIGTSGRAKLVAGRIGSGTVKIAIPELAKLTGAYIFIQQHDICVFYLNDGSDRRLGQFVIRSVKLAAGSAGQPSFFTLGGPDPLYYLGKVTNHLNIGEETTGYVNASTGMAPSSTELQVDYGDIQDEDSDDPSPFWPKYSIKKAQTLQIGDGVLQLIKVSEAAKDPSEQWANGDTIWISREDGTAAYDNVFKTHITAVPVVGVDYLEVTLGETSAVSIKSGDRDSPENYFPMFKPHIFAGDPIRVQQADTTWHTSKAERIAYRGIILDEGPTGTVNAGAEFIWRDVRTPNTINDITRIMENATAWTVSGAASSKGTAHQVDGQSTYDLLEAAAKATGDHFYASQASATAPNLTLTWVASSPSSGLTFIEPTQAAMQAAVASSTNIIIHSINRVSKDLPTTRVIPQGAQSDEILANWGLDLRSETAVEGLLRLHGITAIDAMTTEYVNGAWRVRNTTSLIQSEETIQYDIIPVSESMEDLIEGSNRLQAAAALHLHVKRDTERLFDISTVLPSGVNVNPGETVTLTYTNDEWVESKTLYIAEYEYFVQNTGKLRGLLQCRMILSEYGPYPRETGAILVARAMKQGLGGSGSVQVGAGGGGTIVPGEAITIASSTPVNALTAAGSELTFLATSDGDTNPSTVLYTDANGRIRVDGMGVNTAVTGAGLQVDGNLAFIGPQAITTDSGDLSLVPTGDLAITADAVFQGARDIRTSAGALTLQPVGNLIIDPDSDLAELPTTVDIEGQGFAFADADGFTQQWRLDTGLGAGYFAYLEADQMHIRLFQADVTMAKANSFIITDSVAELAVTFTIPAVSGTVDIYVHDNPALGAAQVFQDNDWIRMRVFERSSGLDLFDLWGQVASYVDIGDGRQRWTMTVRYAGPADAAVGLPVQAGGVVLGYGFSGQGAWEADARRTIGPYNKTSTWAGANPYTASNWTDHTMSGRLLSITNRDEYGFFAGVSATGPRAIISDNRAELYDMGLTIYTGTADSGVIKLYALEFNSDIETGVYPNGDIDRLNIIRSSGTGTWFSHINENAESGQPDLQWLYNTAGGGGVAWFDVADLSHTMTTLNTKAYIEITGFVDDTCSVWVQLYKADQVTELTNAVKICSQSTSDGLVSVPFVSLTTGTDGEWAAATAKVTWIYNVVGSSEAIVIDPETGISISGFDSSSIPPETGWAPGDFGLPSLTFLEASSEGTDTRGSIHADGGTTILPTMFLNAYGSATYVKLELAAYTSTSGDNTKIKLNTVSGASSVDVILDDSQYFSVGKTTSSFDSNLHVDSNALWVGVQGPTGSTLLGLDQGTDDNHILEARSSTDLTALTTQGMNSNATYFELSKISALDGGALLRGGGEGSAVRGLQITGSANTGTSVLTEDGLAPLTLVGQVDAAGVGSTNNCIVMRSGTITRWVLQGDGDTFQDGDMYDSQDFTPDYLDDVMAVRATMLVTGKAIPTEYDSAVHYSRSDLEELGVLKGEHRNRSKISELHSGSIWQLHQRLATLERRIVDA